ncbi:MAG: hypothetical protein JOY92_17365 [Verrucomicrobia bacterium]|nr:hypothetical protein [Verrucomicrobiota bacterium]
MIAHPQIQWQAPNPLWGEFSRQQDFVSLRRPALLRFASDGFMQDLQSLLQSSPQRLRDYVAQGETWRAPAAGLDAAPQQSGTPLKLFQPIHARFYLVAASLTCRMPGLPDRTVNVAQGEKVSFVIRQLRPKPGTSPGDFSSFDPLKVQEQAWIPGSPSGWANVTGPGLVEGEERLPLAPNLAGVNGSSRRILTGLIPSSRRQQYVSARVLTNGNGSGNGNGNGNGTPDDPRKNELLAKVIAPWGNQLDWWNSLPAATQAQANFVTSTQQSSSLILLDLANFLITYVRPVWDAIQDPSKAATLSSANLALYHGLGAVLPQALVKAKQFEASLEGAPISDPFPPAGYTPAALTDPSVSADPDTLQNLIEATLPDLNQASLQPAPPSPQKKPSNPNGDFWYVVRCVYERPQCGVQALPVMSEPSRPFQLASFFDPDAPARQLQVALPVDTSPAALRKYDKGVAFLISDELQNQIQRVKSLKDLADGNLDSSGSGIGVQIGLICSFSIPIITICALILLLVIVIALNLVFFWLPFFRICFPVPVLKGKP